MIKHSRCAGVTLLELLVTIAIIGILASIAYPALQNLLRDGRVVSQANELAAMVTYAHSQATQGIPRIELAIVPGTNWIATLSRRPDENSEDRIDLRSMAGRNTELTVNGQNVIRVNNRGLVVSNPVCLVLEHQPGGQFRSVTVRVSGQVLVARSRCES